MQARETDGQPGANGRQAMPRIATWVQLKRRHTGDRAAVEMASVCRTYGVGWPVRDDGTWRCTPSPLLVCKGRLPWTFF